MGVNADTSRSERRPGARRVEAPRSDPQFSAAGTAAAGPDSGSVGPLGGDTTEDLHLRYGNAVVEAALAGGEGFYADIAADISPSSLVDEGSRDADEFAVERCGRDGLGYAEAPDAAAGRVWAGTATVEGHS